MHSFRIKCLTSMRSDAKNRDYPSKILQKEKLFFPIIFFGKRQVSLENMPRCVFRGWTTFIPSLASKLLLKEVIVKKTSKTSFFNRNISRFFASERLLVRRFIKKRCVSQQNVINKRSGGVRIYVTTRVGLKIAVKDEPIFFRKGGFSQKRLNLRFCGLYFWIWSQWESDGANH